MEARSRNVWGGIRVSSIFFFFFCDSMDSLVRVSIVYTGKNNYYKVNKFD